MEIKLELSTSDPSLATQLLETSEVVRGSEVEIVDQTHLRFKGRQSTREMGTQELLLFVLSFPVGVATSMIASALYDFLKKRKHQINRVKLEYTTVLEEARAGTNRHKRRSIFIDLHQSDVSDAEVVAQITRVLAEAQEVVE